MRSAGATARCHEWRCILAAGAQQANPSKVRASPVPSLKTATSAWCSRSNAGSTSVRERRPALATCKSTQTKGSNSRHDSRDSTWTVPLAACDQTCAYLEGTNKREMPRQLPCAQGSRRGRGRVRRPPDMRHATNALATPKIGSHLAQILQALEEGGVLRCRPRYTYAQRGCREVSAFGLLPCGSSAKCAMPHGWVRRAFLPTARPKQTAARLAPSLGTAKSDTTTHTHKARASSGNASRRAPFLQPVLMASSLELVGSCASACSRLQAMVMGATGSCCLLRWAGTVSLTWRAAALLGAGEAARSDGLRGSQRRVCL